MAFGVVSAVHDHAETAIDDLSPAHAAAIMDRHPRGATERIADYVLDGHVGTEL